MGRRHQRGTDAAAGGIADPVLSRWRPCAYGAGFSDDGRRVARRPGFHVTDVAVMTAGEQPLLSVVGPRSQVRRRRSRGQQRRADCADAGRPSPLSVNPARESRRPPPRSSDCLRRADESPRAASIFDGVDIASADSRRLRSIRGTRHRLCAAGPDDQPQPGMEGRLSDTGSIARQRHQRCEATVAATARRSRHAGPADSGQTVSASAVRWDVSACADCDRAGGPAAPADRRRADVSTGRHRATAGARSSAASWPRNWARRCC